MKFVRGSRGAVMRAVMRDLVRGSLCVIAFMGPFQGASAAAAEAPGLAALRRQVNTLNSVVLDLQARVRQLEARLAASSATTPAKTVPAATRVPAAAPLLPAAKPAESRPAVVTAAPAGTGAGYLSPEALLRQRWSTIETDMADTRVRELLGEPSKKFKLNGRTVWYYYYPGTGVGSVFFTDAGRVSSKQSPFGWNW